MKGETMKQDRLEALVAEVAGEFSDRLANGETAVDVDDGVIVGEGVIVGVGVGLARNEKISWLAHPAKINEARENKLQIAKTFFVLMQISISN